MKAGEKYVITKGCYSDFGISDCFIAAKTFSFDEERRRWIADHDGMRDWDREQKFLQHLRDADFVIDTPTNEIWLGDCLDEDNPADDKDDDR